MISKMLRKHILITNSSVIVQNKLPKQPIHNKNVKIKCKYIQACMPS